MTKDYYKVLQVSKDASEDELKKAYRRLANIYHPDNNPGNKEAEIKFQEINESYAILINPEKRKQYDMKFTIDTTIDSDNHSIFNELFGSDIRKYNEERDDYIKFLEKMEEKFNQYNRSLKKEKEAALNSTWSALMLDSFYSKKQRVERRLKELELNAEAFDDFLSFFEKAQEEAKKYNLIFNSISQYIEPSKRGLISSSFYLNLKSQIKNQLNTISRQINAFDEYMQFLDEMEEKFNQYNRTIKRMKKELENQRGKITIDQISAVKQEIKKELLEMERRAYAFDTFSEYYLKINQEIQTLYGKKLTNFEEYLNPKNRISFDSEIFNDQKIKIKNIISHLNLKRLDKLKQLMKELEKRNLNFNAYLTKRNLNEFTISVPSIEKILKSLELIDQINEKLALFGITIEDYLKLSGKSLINMEYEELLAINDEISNNNTFNFEDMDPIIFQEIDIAKK